MTAQILELRRPGQLLQCSSCGASTDAACECGVAYVPAAERAAEAIAANPEKSDRAIGADLGIDHKTVGKARKSVGDLSPPAKRIGKDGKSYPAKGKARRKAKIPFKEAELIYQNFMNDGTESDDVQTIWRRGILNRSANASAMALFEDWSQFKSDRKLVNAAKRAADAWTKLAAYLETLCHD